VINIQREAVSKRNRRETAPLLQSPADEHLSIIFSMLVRDGRDSGVIEHPLLSPDERTVRLYDDTGLLAIIYDFSLLAERVKLNRANGFEMSRERTARKYNRRLYLNLVHCWGLEPRLSDLLEVADTAT